MAASPSAPLFPFVQTTQMLISFFPLSFLLYASFSTNDDTDNAARSIRTTDGIPVVFIEYSSIFFIATESSKYFIHSYS